MFTSSYCRQLAEILFMVVFLTPTETGEERLCYKAFITRKLSSGQVRRRVPLDSLKIKLSSYCNVDTYLLFHFLCRPIQGTYGQTLDTKPWLIQAKAKLLIKTLHLHLCIMLLLCQENFNTPFFIAGFYLGICT